MKFSGRTKLVGDEKTKFLWTSIGQKVTSLQHCNSKEKHQTENEQQLLKEMIEKFYENEEISVYIQKAYTFGIPVKQHGEHDVFKKQVDFKQDRYLQYKKKSSENH